MKVSESWLHSLINLNVSTEVLCDQFTMLGLEVETFESLAPTFTNVVVGEILTTEKHPKADRLKVCTVNVGAATPLNIVCGGINARAGIRVAVATVGAVLPGNFEIKEAKLRDVISQGMLCAEDELGLAKTMEGIMELAADAPIGKNLREYLGLDDHVISLNITPNRGDCLSMIGLVRELAIKNKIIVTAPKIKALSVKSKEKINVEIKIPEACPLYCSRIIKNINNNGHTPDYMIKALSQSGVRSISPVVDILNYVMLLVGQPMHAFDRSKIGDTLEIRFAKPNETLTLLNDQQISLHENVLVISDAHKALAMAGIMGAKNSEVDAGSTEVVLESAFFTPKFISGRARQFGLHTESSQRFERGVDFALPERAIELASQLIIDICGGEAAEIVVAKDKDHMPQSPEVTLYYRQVEKLLGQTIDVTEISKTLTGLGCKILKKDKTMIKIEAPSWRFDISIPEDLIEEVARIHGYDHFQPQVPSYPVKVGHKKEIQNELNSIKAFLCARGQREVITFSFIDSKDQQFFKGNKKVLSLKNPISSDLGEMRLSLMPSLIKVLQYNERRQIESIRIFEIGRIYEQQAESIVETDTLGVLLYGAREPDNWYGNSLLDFYDLKGLIEALFQFTDIDFNLKTTDIPAWVHPGQGASIWVNGENVGYLGALHPQCQAVFELKHTPLVFELKLSALDEGYMPKAKAISKYPSIRRDLALVVPETYSSEQIIKTIVQIQNDILMDVFIFDVYQGEHLAVGTKSIAVALILQHDDRTLVDEEVEKYLQQVKENLNNLGIMLRT